MNALQTFHTDMNALSNLCLRFGDQAGDMAIMEGMFSATVSMQSIVDREFLLTDLPEVWRTSFQQHAMNRIEETLRSTN